MKTMFRNCMLLLVAVTAMAGSLLYSTNAMAQGGAAHHYMNMNGGVRNDTIDIPGEGIYLHSGYNNGAVDSNANLWVVLTGHCTDPNLLSLTVEAFDIDPSDTLYIYDGPSTASPLIYKGNNEYNAAFVSQIFFPSVANTSQALTVAYRTTKPDKNGAGFSLQAMCRMPCEQAVPHIDSIYYKMRNGVITDTVIMGMGFTVDTVLHVNDDGDSTWVIDTTRFRAVNLCQGEDVMFRGYGIYTNQYNLYAPMDATTTFKWNLGNGDTAVGLEVTEVIASYNDLDCYDVTLSLLDEQGCPSAILESVTVRLAQMPIKTIYGLATICNVDSVLVNVGYEGDNGAITLQKIEFKQTKSKTNQVRTFIPDGPYCTELGMSTCFTAPVAFNEFPNGRTVQGVEDICSICVNYEHTFMGDYTMAIICPSGASARLKTKNGGGLWSGFPLDSAPWDGSGSSAIICDSLNNPYGVGLEYCFSKNADYTFQNGLNASDETPASDDNYMNQATNARHTLDTTITYPVIPAPFVQAGQSRGEARLTTCKPSNHEDRTGYYKPEGNRDQQGNLLETNPFINLIGCPLNGIWSIEVCDTWGADNGWIFSWSLDICGISAGRGCKYQVELDSVVWRPDSTYGDFDNLTWRGVVVRPKSPGDKINAYISSPDTAGTFPLIVSIYDEFGCQWDTTCTITTVWTPAPNLINDTALCSSDTLILDATDRHTETQNQTFMWEPFGEDTPTIITATGLRTSTLYTVEVTNEMSNIRCRTRDSVRIKVVPQPIPNIDMGDYPLEGCEPFILNINNTTVDGDTYHWDFGDGDTSNVKNPQHVYAAGTYNFKYYVSSEGGCKDSLIYDSLITVYPSPKAMFSWDPINPTVLHPTVQFENRTRPQDDVNDYYWEIQYDRDNPISYHTLTETNPKFTWTTEGEDISGSYIARLIAKTATLGPSGEVVECRDTIENTIMLVNDFLQFPNVVTANGDGINDRFEIKNLVEGKGYPNNSLAIYDRWGKRVYFKENIADKNDFWDPAAENMPAGTYFWRFSGKGYLGNIERTGSVEVLVK